MKKIIFSTMILLAALPAFSFSIQEELQKGPVMVPVYNQSGSLVSIRGTMLMNVSFKYIWEAITDIKRYKEFFPRMIKSEVQSIKNNGQVIIGDFEIKVPIFVNTVYSNRYVIDKGKGKVDIYQHSGHLEGTHFHWRLRPVNNNQTWVTYMGITHNYNPIIERIDDKDQSVALTINLSAILTTIHKVYDRARYLQKQDK